MPEECRRAEEILQEQVAGLEQRYTGARVAVEVEVIAWRPVVASRAI